MAYIPRKVYASALLKADKLCPECKQTTLTMENSICARVDLNKTGKQSVQTVEMICKSCKARRRRYTLPEFAQMQYEKNRTTAMPMELD